MRKIATLIVLVLLSTGLTAQKIHNWEGGAPGPHVPARSIFEKVNVQLPEGSGAEEVRQALLAMKPEIAQSGCDLQLAHEKESPGGFHFTFRQTLNGIPIHEATIKANLTPGRRMVAVLSNVTEPAAPLNGFQASNQDLENYLYIVYYKDQRDFSFEYERVWYLSEGTTVPAFRVELAGEGKLWELVLADAGLHDELSRRDLASYCRPLPPPPVDTTGYGMVFNPDPLTTTGNVYGGNYVDADDADNSFLSAERVSVVLQDIDWNGTYFLLQGPYVKILDVESPSIPPVFSSDGNFNYTRDQSGFEDVMVYYHIDTYQRYVQSLGFTNLMNAPLTADPHGLYGQDNSHFVPQGGNVRVAFGEGGVDDAEDADVIVHEYGHALSYSASPGTNGGTERLGLDEGIGDYIAASYSKGLYYALWKNTFTWDGHNEYWAGRSASINMQYPPNDADIYNYGQIWASTLMEVHNEIGRVPSDRVFLESLYWNLSNMTLTDAAKVVMTVDSILYGGVHWAEYQDAFCRRGIFQGTQPGQDCYPIATATTDPFLNGSSWQLFPNPAQSVVTLHLEGIARHKDLSYRLVNLLGQELTRGEIRQEYTEASVQNLESGLYLMELWQGTARVGSKRLEIMR